MLQRTFALAIALWFLFVPQVAASFEGDHDAQCDTEAEHGVRPVRGDPQAPAPRVVVVACAIEPPPPAPARLEAPVVAPMGRARVPIFLLVRALLI